MQYRVHKMLNKDNKPGLFVASSKLSDQHVGNATKIKCFEVLHPNRLTDYQ